MADFIPPYLGACLDCGHPVSGRSTRAIWQALVDHITGRHSSPTVSAPGRATQESGSPDHDPTGALSALSQETERNGS